MFMILFMTLEKVQLIFAELLISNKRTRELSTFYNCLQFKVVKSKTEATYP